VKTELSNYPGIVAPNGRPAVDVAVENNWYEGSRWSPHRSWVWFPLQDAKRDLDRFTRYELCKHSRYLYKNSPFIRGLIERLVNLVIGSGLHAVPCSSKPDWNDRAKAAWKRICRQPCVNSRQSMAVYQRIKARGRFVDGESFTLKTFAMETGRDKIQGLEADRVTSRSAAARNDDSADRNVDGVILNRQGMPAAYQVRGVDRPYAAENVVHHFTPLRDGQVRGEPLLASGINTARDVDDILALEKQAVKEASSHKDIIKTNTGDLNPETMRTLRYNANYPTVMSLPNDQKTRDDYYRISFGSQPVVLRTGDEYTPYKPDRPGSAWQGFMAFLANTIVLSTGLPPSLLLPVNIGGTDVRRDLELGQRIIKDWQADIAAEFQEIWEYFMEGEIEDGSLHDAPADWNEVRWHFPKNITVDRGRDAMQDRADVQAGLMSRDEYHGRYGDDGNQYEQTVIAEAARRKDLIEAAGFDSIMEFVQVLSLDTKLFTSRVTENVTPQDEDLDPSKDPKNAVKEEDLEAANA
jgi:capsid protein